MNNIITIPRHQIKVNFKRSRRARSLRLTVGCNSAVLTAPWWVSRWQVNSFLKNNINWLVNKINYYKKFKPVSVSNSYHHYLVNKAAANKLVKQTVAELSAVYNFAYNKIFIKRQISRWGSCSKFGNLNFNYKLVFLAPELARYIVAHELCHLKEFNHSPKFWQLVAKAEPNYKQLRHELKKIII